VRIWGQKLSGGALHENKKIERRGREGPTTTNREWKQKKWITKDIMGKGEKRIVHYLRSKKVQGLLGAGLFRTRDICGLTEGGWSKLIKREKKGHWGETGTGGRFSDKSGGRNIR